MINTQGSILAELKSAGIKKSDTLFVHSSYKSIGGAEGGPETVLNALSEAVCDGLLVLPTHTWKTMSAEHNVFDPESEPSCVGILTELFRKKSGTVRSLHPTHSVAVAGDGASEFAAGEEMSRTPCPRSGCMGKLYDRDARILMLGCGLNRFTYMHAVEEWFGVRGRLTAEALPLRIKMSDGTLKEAPMKKHFKPGGVSISENYTKLETPFLQRGIAQKFSVGAAQCLLINARQAAELAFSFMETNMFIFSDLAPIPSGWVGTGKIRLSEETAYILG